MKILLPDHSEACHCITVYDGVRYVCEHLVDRKILGNEFDVAPYVGLKEARFEHAPANLRGGKQPYEYRAIARMDGVFYPYNPTAPNWGLPALAEPEVTNLHPADVQDAKAQEATQPEAKKSESLAPASDKEKKSRTR